MVLTGCVVVVVVDRASSNNGAAELATIAAEHGSARRTIPPTTTATSATTHDDRPRQPAGIPPRPSSYSYMIVSPGSHALLRSNVYQSWVRTKPSLGDLVPRPMSLRHSLVTGCVRSGAHRTICTCACSGQPHDCPRPMCQVDGMAAQTQRGVAFSTCVDTRHVSFERSRPVAMTTASSRRWADDLDAIAELGVRAVRLSLDWARLQPRPRELDGEWVEWYGSLLTTSLGLGLGAMADVVRRIDPEVVRRRGWSRRRPTPPARGGRGGSRPWGRPARRRGGGMGAVRGAGSDRRPGSNPKTLAPQRAHRPARGHIGPRCSGASSAGRLGPPVATPRSSTCR